MHLTLSDGLIILAFLRYGTEIAIVVSLVEVVAGSLNIRRKGMPLSARTLVVNLAFAVISVVSASLAVNLVFGSPDLVLARGEISSFIWLLGVVTLTLFAVNSALASIWTSLNTDSSFVKVWTGNCLSGMMMYLTGAVVAGMAMRWLTFPDPRQNIYILAAIIGFFGAIYLTFRKYNEDLRHTVDKARRAERDRAEQAEAHVKELEHYIKELEMSGEALKESHENFKHAAYHDGLTGLPNRNYFLDELKGLLQQSRDGLERNFAVLFLDLRSFKTINDSLGHGLGDRLIKNVAKRVLSLVREEDVVARFSGDKFGVILTDLLSRDEATAFADRLARRLSEPYTLDGRQVFTSAKMGIAFGNSKYPEAEDILRDADIAMYYAKENDDNYVIFDPKMHVRAVTRLQLETDLRYAIDRHEFELYYQPIISLETAQLVGVEALVRWNHPQRGLVPPGEFIPVCESTGLIIPMTVQILKAACSQVVRWGQTQTDGRPLSVAVNLSGKHFAHPALVDQINNVLAETGIDPALLKLELTESAVMENAESAIRMLKQIKETGVQISIDDFGTGYSSLSYLHRFPIDLLKVDRSFVSEMEENTENGEIVRTVIALAKALRLKVVAEGIESIHQFHQLRVLGCEFGQGYLFSKPLPVAELERLLVDNNRWQNILPTPPPLVVPQNGSEKVPLRMAH